MSGRHMGKARRLRRGGFTLAAGLALSAAFAACGQDSVGPAQARELTGAPVSVGNGTARTFVRDSAGTVTAIGIELTDAALTGLPSTMPMTEWPLLLPTGAAVPPWDHVGLDWNPQGHPPPQIYGVPHFDFHFYAISPAQQQAIQGGPDTVSVPAANVPTDYASQVISVPGMGVHWADTLSTEYHGHAFDKTLIYGFSHGRMIFLEPMITLATLQSHPDVSAAIKQPKAFQQPGLYPRSYSVQYDAAAGVTRITLGSLVRTP